MFRIKHDYVDSKFIACILETYSLSQEHVQLSNSGIGNPVLVKFIEGCYRQFVQSDQDYNFWFERQIIECSYSPGTNRSKVPDDKIESQPLFLAKRTFKRKEKSEVQYFYPISGSQMYSIKPIPIELDSLLEFLKIDIPSDLSTRNCPSSINLYKYENGKIINDHTCPGLSDAAIADIAYENDKYYWVLGQVKKIFKCTKFPGQCAMTFNLKTNREKHESICRIHTKVTSKMVNILFACSKMVIFCLHVLYLFRSPMVPNGILLMKL